MCINLNVSGLILAVNLIIAIIVFVYKLTLFFIYSIKVIKSIILIIFYILLFNIVEFMRRTILHEQAGFYDDNIFSFIGIG